MQHQHDARVPLGAEFREAGHSATRLMHNILLAMTSGPARVIRSSRHLSWRGLLLERHVTSPGERSAASTRVHVVSQFVGSPTRFDYCTAYGHFQSCLNRPGTLMITPQGAMPEIRLHTRAELIHCALEPDFVRGIEEELEAKPTSAPLFNPGLRDKSIQRILGMLNEELDARRPLGRLYVDSLAHALVTRLLLLDPARSPRAKCRVSALPLHILKRVQEKIDANLETELSVTSLASETGYSRSHFLRMFRVATGLTPHQYVLSLRLKRAQNSLRHKNSSIIDIALTCGFSSQSHMTSVFRQRLEMTPAEFRRNA